MTASPQDLTALSLVGSPSIDPAGGRVVAAVQTVDPGSLRYRSRLWSFAADRPATPLTEAGPWSDTLPRFSPDGAHLAFLSDRDGLRRVWVSDGGEPRVAAVLDGPHDSGSDDSGAEDSGPDGSGPGGVAARPTALDGPHGSGSDDSGPEGSGPEGSGPEGSGPEGSGPEGSGPGGVEARPTAILWTGPDRLLVLAERPAEPSDGGPVVIDWLRYKADGAAGPLEPTGELWTVGLDGSAALLHRSEDRLSCLAHDGRSAYYVVVPRHSDDLAPGSDLARVPLGGGTEERLWHCASPIQAVAVTAPAVVPGKEAGATAGTVLALASDAPGQSVVPPQVWVVAGPGVARPEPAFPDADLECERALLSDCRPRTAPVLLSTAGDEALFVATVRDEVALFRARPGREPVRISPPGSSVVDFDAAAGSVALSLESATRPTELHLDGTPVSDLNTRWCEAARPVAPEHVTVDAPDGLALPGLLYRAPAGGGSVLLRVHGGPHLAFGNTFDLETQVQLAAGYHVLVPNVRGSAGHGARFRAMSVGEWGRADHADLMAFADWAVQSGTGDPGGLYLAGGSYGGYLINWTLTRTDRFRAAVSERSVSNLLSKYGTSDNGFTVNRYEFGGLDLFDDGAHELLDRSPLHHADKVTTPLLLVHGERDQRCPIEQSEQLFAALRRLGREAVFVRFPGESHGFTAGGRPDRRIERLKLIIAWLDAHPAAGRSRP